MGPSRSPAVLLCELTVNCLAQAGDAVWEAEGVVPLAAMLDSRDPEQFKAAASAIAELANPKNRAFQVRALPMLVPLFHMCNSARLLNTSSLRIVSYLCTCIFMCHRAGAGPLTVGGRQCLEV